MGFTRGAEISTENGGDSIFDHDDLSLGVGVKPQSEQKHRPQRVGQMFNLFVRCKLANRYHETCGKPHTLLRRARFP